MEGNKYSVPCIYPIRDASMERLRANVPGSKSITNRALILAAMAGGDSVIQGMLFGGDSRSLLGALESLGFAMEVDEAKGETRIRGLGGVLPLDRALVYVGSAGTAARFLTAWLGISQGSYTLDSSEQMRRRPMADLLDSLQDLGCGIRCLDQPGHFPFVLEGRGFAKGHVEVNVDASSQYLSGLLMAAPLSGRDMVFTIAGSHGMAYVNMTLRMMEEFGVSSQRLENGDILIPGGQKYRPRLYKVEPDMSAAAYFYAMSPLLGVEVQVRGIHRPSLQGDVEFLDVLERLGCRQEDHAEGILLLPPESEHYPGIDVEMASMSDQAITMAVLAAYGTTPTLIRNIAHIRRQESDRMEAICDNLGRMGILTKQSEHNLTIYPGRAKGAGLPTRDDHRLAMGFALAGLRTPGVIIEDPDCCKKSFEGFFSVLDGLVAPYIHKETAG